MDANSAADNGVIYGDAFKDDNRTEAAKGRSLHAEHEFVSSAASSDLLAECKSNNVSFMKLEPLPVDCRSVLAVSDAYICYAVTQKRNLLRVIDSQSGEKSLLRGHQHCVADVCFSPADARCCCSVDSGINGTADQQQHVFFWQLAASGDWEQRGSLPLRAKRAVPHPLRSSCFALLCCSSSSDCTELVVVDATTADAARVMRLPAGEVAIDAAFSSSGEQLLVALAATATDGSRCYRVQLFAVVADSNSINSSSGSFVMQAIYSASQAQQLVMASAPESALLAVQCLRDQHVLTVTTTDCSSGSGVASYVLTVWHCPLLEIAVAVKDNTAAAAAGDVTGGRMFPLPSVVQSLTLELPLFAPTTSAAVAVGQFDCALCLEPGKRRYVVLTSRRSALAACISLSPRESPSQQQQQQQQQSQLPLQHVSLLDLRAPVLSVDAVTVLGQQHHSAEQGEHIELSCYQEAAAADPNQSSIQQYFAFFAHIFPQPLRTDATAAAAAALMQQNQQAPFVAATPSPAAAAADSNTSTASGWSILSMLNKYNNSSNSGGNSGAVVNESLRAPVIVPVPKQSATTAAATAATTATATPSSSTAAVAASEDSSSILRSLRVASAKNAHSSPSTAAAATSVATVNDLPAFLTAQSPVSARSDSILNILKAAGTRPPAAAATTVAAITTAAAAEVVVAPAVTSGSAETKESAAATAVVATAAAKKSAASEQKGTSSIKAAAAVSPQPAAKPVAAAATAASTAAVVVDAAQFKQLMQQLEAMQEQLKAVQQQMVKPQQLQTTVKGAVEQLLLGNSNNSNGKSTAATATGNSSNSAVVDKLAAAVSAQVASSLQQQLVPQLATKVEQQLKQAMKAQLPAAFKQHFEQLLLPALQAGTQQMFQQLQSACCGGFERLQSDAAALLAQQTDENVALRQEVSELRGAVHELRDVIHTMSQQQQQQNATVVAAVEPPPENALALLRKGDVAAAVMRALEDKEISSIAEVLSLLSPAAVNDKCSPLIRLCVTQQLAADMSERTPIEGIGKRVEWIKNLVLSLLSETGAGSSSAEEGAHFKAHFKQMIAVVLQSIQAAKQMMFNAAATALDDGEDDDSSNSSRVPPSVGTDLQLLEYVIQSKM